MGNVTITAGAEDLHPEYLRLLRGLPCSRVEILDAFKTGRSGNPVLLADITPISQGGHQGQHVVKIVQVRKNRNELIAHQSAQAVFGPLATEIVLQHEERLNFGPESVIPHGTYVAIVYSLAQQSLLHARTLHVLLSEQAGKSVSCIRGFASAMLGVWRNQCSTASLVPTTLVRDNILRSLVRGSSSITNVARQFLGVSDVHPLLGLPDQDLLLPNPVAYLERDAYWCNPRGVSFPQGPIHGDLHSDNVIFLLSRESPALIDFAAYEGSVCVFYDLLYLELSILLTLFTDTKEGWPSFVRYLMTGWRAVDVDPAGSPVALHAAQVLRQLRTPAYLIAKELSREEDFEISFMLAATAVGLNYMRKAGNAKPPDCDTAYKSLLYAAYSLRRALSYLGIPMPRPDPASVVYPEPGEAPSAPEDYEPQFTARKWGHDEELDAATRLVAVTPDRPVPPQTRAPVTPLPYAERELRALSFVEHTLLDRGASIEEAAEAAEHIKRMREYREKVDSSVGPTPTETSDYRISSSWMQKLCLHYYELTLTGLVEGRWTSTQTELPTEVAPQVPERLRVVEEIVALEMQRSSLIQKRQNDIAASLAGGTTNPWLVRELKRIERLIAALKAKAPPAWFTVSRMLELPPTPIVEQPYAARIAIQNEGRELRHLIYVEILPDNVGLVQSGPGGNLTKNRLVFRTSIGPGEQASLSYEFFFKGLGEAAFTCELHYKGQVTEWDELPVTTTKCSKSANPPQLSIARLHRYWPTATEIMLRVTTETGCSLPRDLVLNETVVVEGQARQFTFHIPWQQIRPGHPTWGRYQLDGHHDPADLVFSSGTYAQFKDSGGNRFKKDMPSGCRLLEYDFSRRALIEREQHQEVVEDLVESLANPDRQQAQRVLWIGGPRGSGKSRLLWEVRKRGEACGFRCIYRQVERSANIITRLLYDVLQVAPFDETAIQAALDRLGLEERQRFRTSLSDYLIGGAAESLAAAGSLLVQASFDLLRRAATEAPLIVMLDDVQELQSAHEIAFLVDLLVRVNETGIPVIFTFAETTEEESAASAMARSQLRTEVELRLSSVKALECSALTEDGADELIDSIVDYPRFDNELKHYVFKLSQGIPQYVIDILQWLTTSEGTLELHGNQWTRARWLTREEARFKSAVTIMPHLAATRLSPDAFGYLRILSVVGEKIPPLLAEHLHKRFFPTETGTDLEKKLQALVDLHFLRPLGDGQIRFSHLSRRNSIYEDPGFPSGGSKGKDDVRSAIYEIIKSDITVYRDPDERILQAAHHLSKCPDEIQTRNLEDFLAAADISLKRHDLRLGRKFTDDAIRLRSAQGIEDLRVLRLNLLVAHHMLELTGDYEEVLSILARTEAPLGLDPDAEIKPAADTEHDMLRALALTIKAEALLEADDLDSVNQASELSRLAVHILDHHRPRVLPVFGKIDFHKFRYDDLITAYLTHFRSMLARIDLDQAGREHHYTWKEYALESEAKAMHLTEQVLKAPNVEPARLLSIQMQFADICASRGDFEHAIPQYQKIQKAAHDQTLPYFEGRASHALARCRLVRRLNIKESLGEDELLPIIFADVMAVENGERPSSSGVNEEMVKLYQNALMAHRRADDQVRAAEAEAVLGIMSHVLGEAKSALTQYESAAEYFGETGRTLAQWICLLGGLTLRLKEEQWPQAATLWGRLYSLYLETGEEEADEGADLPHLDYFAKLARSMEGYFANQKDQDSRLEALNVIVNTYCAQIAVTDLYAYAMHFGDLLLEQNDLTGACATYQRSLDLAGYVDIPDSDFVESAWRLVRLMQKPEWHPNHLQAHEQVWGEDEVEFYFTALCRHHLDNEELSDFYEVYLEFLDELERNGSYLRFPKTFLEFLEDLIAGSMTDRRSQIEHLVDCTTDYFVGHHRLGEAAELLTYTGMQFARTETNIENTAGLAIGYFKRAEELFIQAGEDAVIYGLSGLFFGYLLFGDEDGFSRCALRLMDWTIGTQNFEELTALMDNLLTGFTSRTKLSGACLEGIIGRLERALSVFGGDKFSRSSLFLYLAEAHLFLAEKLQKIGLLKTAENEARQAMRLAADMLSIGKADRSRVFNIITLCYGSMGDKLKQAVASQEEVRSHQATTDRGVGWGISLVNLASDYLRLGMAHYAPTLLHEALNSILGHCLELDWEVQGMDVSNQSGLSLVVSAGRARSNLRHLISTWGDYIAMLPRGVPDHEQLLRRLWDEQQLLTAQINQPQLIIHHPLIGHEWPMHLITVGATDEEGHITSYNLNMTVQLPPSPVSLNEALSARIPNAPSPDELLKEIRSWDLEALRSERPRKEEPAPSIRPEELSEWIRRAGVKVRTEDHKTTTTEPANPSTPKTTQQQPRRRRKH